MISEGAPGENFHIFHLTLFPFFKSLLILRLVHLNYLDAKSNKFANGFRTPVVRKIILQVTSETKNDEAVTWALVCILLGRG